MQTIYNGESYSLSYSDFGEITEQLFNPSQGLLPMEQGLRFDLYNIIIGCITFHQPYIFQNSITTVRIMTNYSNAPSHVINDHLL